MVLNVVIRMVVPMRREFGRSLDVQQFMHDPGYAQTVLEQALASRDERLRQYAQQVQQHLFGPRVASSPAPAVPAAALPPTAAASVAEAAPAAAAPAPVADPTEAELRARMLRRYTTGLR